MHPRIQAPGCRLPPAACRLPALLCNILY
jgi:hypothetical protein